MESQTKTNHRSVRMTKVLTKKEAEERLHQYNLETERSRKTRSICKQNVKPIQQQQNLKQTQKFLQEIEINEDQYGEEEDEEHLEEVAEEEQGIKKIIKPDNIINAVVTNLPQRRSRRIAEITSLPNQIEDIRNYPDK